MSYLDWHVGMKVVCVKVGAWEVLAGTNRQCQKPKYGEICTITEIVDGTSGICVALEGYDRDAVFRAHRFRPVQPRKTSIAIFTAMLDSAKNKVPA